MTRIEQSLFTFGRRAGSPIRSWPNAVGEGFEPRVAAMPEVVELRRMFGIPDYFIRVRVTDIEHYERWLTTDIMGDVAIARMDSRLTMKLLKN